MIEFILGNRQTTLLKVHAHVPSVWDALQAEMSTPSLYQTVLSVVAAHLDTECVPNAPATEPWVAQDAIRDMWKTVYESPTLHWQYYELAEKLVDLEDYFRRWRFNHVTTVERIIGFKRGTGGTAGVGYLRKMLEVELFPELWAVRGVL